MAELEIIGTESTQNKITSKYLDFQLGFITEFITPVDHSLPLSDAVAMLQRDETIPGLAVEEMDKLETLKGNLSSPMLRQIRSALMPRISAKMPFTRF
ncbi:MAG: hypothetical protein EHM28_10625 [Spirochaetaceae bacterium]|nr:MAG: hypothetical protein EHM28_10625 [Spirochaetaceae bacterium]